MPRETCMASKKHVRLGMDGARSLNEIVNVKAKARSFSQYHRDSQRSPSLQEKTSQLPRPNPILACAHHGAVLIARSAMQAPRDPARETQRSFVRQKVSKEHGAYRQRSPELVKRPSTMRRMRSPSHHSSPSVRSRPTTGDEKVAGWCSTARILQERPSV